MAYYPTVVSTQPCLVLTQNNSLNVKVKVTPEQATKSYNTGITLISALKWGGAGWSTPRSCRFTDRTDIYFTGVWGRPVWAAVENYAPTGIDPRTA